MHRLRFVAVDFMNESLMNKNIGQAKNALRSRALCQQVMEMMIGRLKISYLSFASQTTLNRMLFVLRSVQLAELTENNEFELPIRKNVGQ